MAKAKKVKKLKEYTVDFYLTVRSTLAGSHTVQAYNAEEAEKLVQVAIATNDTGVYYDWEGYTDNANEANPADEVETFHAMDISEEDIEENANTLGNFPKKR